MPLSVSRPEAISRRMGKVLPSDMAELVQKSQNGWTRSWAIQREILQTLQLRRSKSRSEDVKEAEDNGWNTSY